MENETNQEAHHETKHRGKKNQYVIAGIILGLAIIIAGGLAWLYTGNLSSAKEKVFSAIPLPAALVDMKPVSAKAVIERVNLANQLSESQGMEETARPADVYEQLLDTKKIEALANQRNLSVNTEAIDEEYNNIIEQYAAGDAEGFKNELEITYSMTPEEFKNEVIRQELLQSELLIWYNKQEDLNKATFDQTRELEQKISNGENFDDVARQYTQDESTKDFAGDSGMIAYDDLLPEFRDSLQDAKVGDVKMISSRYGNHILKVLELNNDGENGAKQIHLQQIFIKQVGFTEWLSGESDNVKVIKLLNFA